MGFFVKVSWRKKNETFLCIFISSYSFLFLNFFHDDFINFQIEKLLIVYFKDNIGLQNRGAMKQIQRYLFLIFFSCWVWKWHPFLVYMSGFFKNFEKTFFQKITFFFKNYVCGINFSFNWHLFRNTNLTYHDEI